jgi:molybdopterin-guanine dinucleotide biosynthesis protein A
MGRDKATLPFGPECMLQRIVRLLSDVVERRSIVVVAAAGQALPTIPPDVVVARDVRPDRGPLEGLAAGLAVVPAGVEAVYVTSCDVPLLVPDFVRRLLTALDGLSADSEGDEERRRAGALRYDVVVPWDGERHHPLAAAYRCTVLEQVRSLLAADRLRPRSLFELVRTLEVPAEDLRSVDPRLDTLRNLNTPEDYLAALRDAGLEG